MTQPILFANNATTTLASSLAIGATSMALASGTGALFPSPSGGQYFVLTLVDTATGLRNEIIHVTDRTGDVCTIVRAQEGTSDQAWLAGDITSNLWTAGSASSVYTYLAASGGAALVGFLQSGAGAVLRDAYAKLLEMSVSPEDFGGIGDGAHPTEDTLGWQRAAATGRPISLKSGKEWSINANVTVSAFIIGEGCDDGQCTITLSAAGQLTVGDWHCDWSGFIIQSAVNNKIFINNPGNSFFLFHNYRAEALAGATGQVLVQYDTTMASIYFCHQYDFKHKVSYPAKITGNNTQVFNANKIGSGLNDYWQDFLTAITIDGVLACDANEFHGYLESGTNAVSLVAGALRQNRFRFVLDSVTNAFNGGVAVTDPNIWEILSGGFVTSGIHPQNQIQIGPANTKIRATDTSGTPAIPTATVVTITYDSEQFDTLSEFTNGTGEFQPINAGYYTVSAQVISQAYTWPLNSKFQIMIYKNGTIYAAGTWDGSQTSSAVSYQRISAVNAIVHMNGTTDVVDVRIIHNRGADVSLASEPTLNWINITAL